MPAPRPLRLLMESIGVGVVAILVAAIVVLQVWDQPFAVPFDYADDASFYLMELRGLEHHSTYLTNPNLGFPYGQQLYDVPQGGDNLNNLILLGLAKAGGPAFAMNAFILASFGFVAGMGYAVLRLLRVRWVIAGAAGLVYAFLPYHLYRRGGHLLLSNYAMMPLAVLFALALLGDDPPVATGDGVRPRLRFDRRTWLVLAGCAGIASTGAYYAAFAVLLMAVAAVAAALARRSWRHLWAGVALCATVLVVFVLNVAPTIVYWLRNGTSSEVIARAPSETEFYGLRIQQLFSPAPWHRIGALARLGARTLQGPIMSEQGQWLGVVTGAGVAVLLVLLVVSVARVTAGDTDETWWNRPDGRTVRWSGMLLVVSILVGTISGFSYFISTIGVRDIRAWNRIVTVIGFLGVLTLAVVAERWAERTTTRRGASWTRRVLGVGVAAVLLLAWFDQTAPSNAVARAGARPAWDSDRAFFGAMDDELPAGTAVFQFPNLGFPEVPGVNRTQSYDPARAYVHAPGLRWSYGFIRGRHPAWPADLDQRSGEDVSTFLTEAGFGAVVLDRFGYADGGADLERRLGEAATLRGTSDDGRYAWFELEP